MQLVIDEREGVHNQDLKIVNADRSAAINFLGRLDGRIHTLLVLERSDGSQLMVGGGCQHFVVTFYDGKQNFTLRNPVGRDGVMVEVCAGGQYGEYSEAICVTRNEAGEAITLFFDGNENNANWI